MGRTATSGREEIARRCPEATGRRRGRRDSRCGVRHRAIRSGRPAKGRCSRTHGIEAGARNGAPVAIHQDWAVRTAVEAMARREGMVAGEGSSVALARTTDVVPGPHHRDGVVRRLGLRRVAVTPFPAFPRPCCPGTRRADAVPRGVARMPGRRPTAMLTCSRAFLWAPRGSCLCVAGCRQGRQAGTTRVGVGSGCRICDRAQTPRRCQQQHQRRATKRQQVAYSAQQLAPKYRHGDGLCLEAAKPPEPFQTSEPQTEL